MDPSRTRKIFLYGIFKATTEGLLALRGLLLAYFLGPEAFAGWVLFRLATSYGGFAQLGVTSGLEFFVARVGGQDRAFSATAYWRTALGFVFTVFGALALITLGASFFVADSELASGMRWFSGAILTEQLWMVGLAYLRAKGDLRNFAIFELANATLQVLLALVLTPLFGLTGAFASLVGACGLSLLLLAKPLPLTPAISAKTLAELLKVGLPVLASLLLGFTLVSADRLIVAAKGDMALLGLYGFAFAAAGIAGSLARVIHTVIYPDVYASVGAKGEVPALRAHLEDTVIPFAWLLPPAIGVLAIVAGPTIALILPEYIEAIPATRLLLFIGVTAGFERLGALGVVASERQRMLPLFSGVGLILNVTLSTLALRFGLGLQGVAGGALLSNAVFGILTLVFLSRVARVPNANRLIGRLVFPLLWCVAWVAIIGRARPDPSLLSSALSLVIYLVCVLPIVPAGLTELRKLARWPRKPEGGRRTK